MLIPSTCNDTKAKDKNKKQGTRSKEQEKINNKNRPLHPFRMGRPVWVLHVYNLFIRLIYAINFEHLLIIKRWLLMCWGLDVCQNNEEGVKIV